MKLSQDTIRKYLKQGAKLGWCDYDAKEELIKDGEKSNHNKQKVICLNDKKIFNSIEEASNYYYLKTNCHIGDCCKDKRKYTKITNMGIKKYLQWQYYNEYLVKPKTLLINKRQVICLNNNKIFNSIVEAKEYSKLKSASGINACCRKKRKSAGKDPKTGEKLHWMYYKDYFKKIKKGMI